MPEPDERTGMSGGARWAIALVAVVALVVAFFALRGDDDEPETAARPATATQEVPAAEEPAVKDEHTARDEAAGGEGAGGEESGGEESGGVEAPDEQPHAEEPTVPVVRVRDGEPVGGVEEIEVRTGDRIRFRVVADADDEVHLHGYDIEKPVGPGSPATFDAEATVEGRFEVELHGTGTQIAQVDVTPS
jgi:hypothetical protein